MAEIAGFVRPDYRSVEEVFSRTAPAQGGASFAAYVEGELVADLWTGTANGSPWQRDTLSTVMSSTKGLAALCAQVLWDRGELDLDAPVTHYWPEYGQQGKSATLIRHVLTHTSGMLCFTDPGSVLDWDGNGWDDYDRIAERIAGSPPAWKPGSRIGYHAISVGWLLQEIVRRITGQTLGRFFAREVAEPLQIDVHIGTPEEAHGRLADITADESVNHGALARMLMTAYEREVARPGSRLGQAGVYMHGGTFSSHMAFFNKAKARRAEIPAANASANARGLARVYAMLAQGGELDGRRIVSPESISLFRTPSRIGRSAIRPRSGLLRAMPSPAMRYAMGFEGDFGKVPPPGRFGPTIATFGHLGAGGQIGFADPERRVAGAFTRSHLGEWDVSTALIGALYESLDR